MHLQSSKETKGVKQNWAKPENFEGQKTFASFFA